MLLTRYGQLDAQWWSYCWTRKRKGEKNSMYMTVILVSGDQMNFSKQTFINKYVHMRACAVHIHSIYVYADTSTYF